MYFSEIAKRAGAATPRLNQRHRRVQTQVPCSGSTVVERKAGVAKDSHCPKKCTATTVLEGQLTIFIPAPNGHKFVVLEQGETGIFIDYEAGRPNDSYEGHGSISGRLGVKLLPSELTDEPNLNAYGLNTCLDQSS
jgi:hypothetical protein